MQALETLGLKLHDEIGLAELLSENFNPQLYGLTKVQKEKVNALRDVVATYMNKIPQSATPKGYSFRNLNPTANAIRNSHPCRNKASGVCPFG